MFARKLISFFVPGGLFFLAAVVAIRLNLLLPWLPQIARIAPGLILAAAILLGWRFNRSRLVFAVLMLAVADWFLVYFAPESAAAGRLVFNSIALLLPLNLAILSLLQERGIITPRGLCRIFLILVQPPAIAGIWSYRSPWVNAFLNYPILKRPILEHPLIQGFPQPALAALAISFLLLVYGFSARRGPIEKGFFWAWTTVCFALITRSAGHAATFYFCAAGLILVVSVIESSHVMAFRDELTGLPARRSLNEFFARMGNRYALAMVDIDFFKKVNDTYGHDVGDQVLAMVASKLARVRGGGKAFRYGGEEFTLVFPGKSVEEIIPYLEQLRVEIESSPFVIRSRSRPKKKPRKVNPGKSSNRKISVTVSMGAAESPGRNGSPHDVVKEADRALYKAKKTGRNRVCS